MQQPGRPSASTGAGSRPLTCASDRQRSPCGEFTPRRSRPTPTPLRFGTTMGPHALHVAGQSACHHTRCIAPRPTLTSQNAQPHVLGSRGRRFKSGRPDAGQWLVSGFSYWFWAAMGAPVCPHRPRRPGTKRSLSCPPITGAWRRRCRSAPTCRCSASPPARDLRQLPVWALQPPAAKTAPAGRTTARGVPAGQAQPMPPAEPR